MFFLSWLLITFLISWRTLLSKLGWETCPGNPQKVPKTIRKAESCSQSSCYGERGRHTTKPKKTPTSNTLPPSSPRKTKINIINPHQHQNIKQLTNQNTTPHPPSFMHHLSWLSLIKLSVLLHGSCRTTDRDPKHQQLFKRELGPTFSPCLPPPFVKECVFM